jgi:hypothetical protein
MLRGRSRKNMRDGPPAGTPEAGEVLRCHLGSNGLLAIHGSK